MTSFVVVTPSRGLVHSRVVEAVMANVTAAIAHGHDFRGWVLTHGLPIPDAHERSAELGLASGAQALWWVEEDTVPPAGALLAEMRQLEAGAPIVAIDYPVGEGPSWSCIPHFGDDGYGHDIPWCGFGCTLISRRVFETLPRPWLSTAKVYMIKQAPGRVWLEERDNPEPAERRYGQQDIYFFRRAAAAGFGITQLPGLQAAQAKVREHGRPGTNHGGHRIELVSTIERPQVLP